MVKRSSDDLKRLATLGNSLVCFQDTFVPPFSVVLFTRQPFQPQHKTAVQKTSHDMQLSLIAFQKAQKVSAERQRTVVENTRRVIEEDASSPRGDVESVLSKFYLRGSSALTVSPYLRGEAGSSQTQLLQEQEQVQQYVFDLDA